MYFCKKMRIFALSKRSNDRHIIYQTKYHDGNRTIIPITKNCQLSRMEFANNGKSCPGHEQKDELCS